MKKTAILFLIFWWSQSYTLAQCNFTLSGKVIDHHDRQPIEFAEIFIKELGIGALTDSLGNYRMLNLCAGTYTIQFHHFDCDTIIKSVTINTNTIENFYPEHHLELLGLVNIVTDRVPEKNTTSTYEIKERELDQTRGQSLGDALKIVTGVNTIQTGSNISKPVIHGMHSNRILILNNGIRQEGQQWGSEHAPEIDPFIANKITIVKGASSVRYGSDAIAGVILLEPNKLRDSAGINAEINLIGMSNGRAGIASGIIEQNFKKLPALSWRLQGTFKKSGNIQTPNYYLNNTGVEEYNFSAATGWKKKKYGLEFFYSQFNTTLGIFSGSHIGNVTDLYAAIARDEPLEQGMFSYKIDRPSQHIEHELTKIKFYLFTGDIGKINFTYARQYNLRYEYDKHKPRNDSIAALNKPELSFEITTHSGDIMWEHFSVKKFTGTVGISGMKQANTYSGRYFSPYYWNYSAGAYWIERYTKKNFILELGIRYDYRWLQVFKYEKNILISPIHEYENLSGTIGAIYKVTDKLSINLTASNAWRSPAVNELYSNGIHHGAATYEIGDSQLEKETAYSVNGNIKYNSEKIHFEVEVYHNLIDNFIYLQPTIPATVTIHGAFPTFKYTQVNASFTGTDAQINYFILPKLLITGKASILRAYNKTIDDWLIQMPPDKFVAELTYNIKSFNKLKENYLTINTEYNNKQWRVPANSDYLNPPKAFTLINLEVGSTLYFKKQAVQVGLSCNNLMNTSYRNYMNRFRYYSDEMGRNITLRIKIPLNHSPKKVENN